MWKGVVIMAGIIFGLWILCVVRWFYIEVKHHEYKQQVKILSGRALNSNYNIRDLWGILSKLYYL